MEHNLPVIREVNCELRDFDYYFDNLFNDENLSVSYHVRTKFNYPNVVVFFLHFQYVYEEDRKKTLYHTDFLSLVEIGREINKEDEMVKIEKDHLAHMLGMSILMIRGSMYQRLANHILAEYPFPIINPIELLEDNLAVEDDKFFIIIDMD